MKRIQLIFFCCLTVLVHGQTLNTFSVREQKEDIEYIQSQLERLHPGIYTYQSEVEFEQGFETLKSDLLGKQSVFEFYQKLVPVINTIGCGHTILKLPSKELKKIEKSKMLLPLEVRIIDNKIFVINFLEDNSIIQPGDEIVSINGKLSKMIIEQQIQLYPSDGRIQSRKYQMMGKFFAVDYSKFFEVTENFSLEIKSNENIQTVQLKGISYNDFSRLTVPKDKQDLELKIIDSLSTAIITIRNSSSKKKYSEFLEASFFNIHHKKIQNLIIDLRFDSFNRDSDGSELYAYINNSTFDYYDKLEVTEYYDVPKALQWITHYPIEEDSSSGKYYWTIHPQLDLQYPKPNPFMGKVFVLTDGFTFSAITEFSSIVKSNKRGIIVGIETGGGYYGNNSGGMMTRVLPNSQIKVVIPPMKYIMAVEDLRNYDRGVLPDVPVEENINDIISGRDCILITALELTRQLD